MKFFVHFKEDTSAKKGIPTSVQLDLVESTRPYFDGLKSSEKVLDWGFFGVGTELYAIFNVRTHGELFELTELAPLRPMAKLECRPVIDQGEFSDVFGRIRKETLSASQRWNKNVA